MSCDNLQYEISVSKTNPIPNEPVTCKSVVKNTGTTTEKFHMSFYANDNDPFYTSEVLTILPGGEIAISTSFYALTTGDINICSDLICDTVQVPQYTLGVMGDLKGVQIFPKDHVWNTRCDNLPVHARSADYINRLVLDTSPCAGAANPCLRHYFYSGKATGGGLPYNVVDSSTPHTFPTSHFNNNDAYSDYVQYPIPRDLAIETISDGHAFVVDVDDMKLYELAQAKLNADGTWSSSNASVWDLNGYEFRKNGTYPMWSTDAAGLPGFPGLARYDEVSRGVIPHALRCGVPHMGNSYVFPARAYAPMPSPYDDTYPPAGLRIRLKASFDISGFPYQAKVIAQCLKTYGMMVADNTAFAGTQGSTTVIGTPDSRWINTDLDWLMRIPITALEAVDITSVIKYPNAASPNNPMSQQCIQL